MQSDLCMQGRFTDSLTFPVLSGTPLQNDLQEYWSMVGPCGFASAHVCLPPTCSIFVVSQADFACPGLLDTYSAFSKIYEKPILKSRAPRCSAKDQQLGQARAEKVRLGVCYYKLLGD